jgi:hypothetical protein
MFDLTDSGDLYGARMGVGYYLLDALSVHGNAVALYLDAVDQGDVDGDDSVGVGWEFVFRWYVLRGDSWATYFDGGLGVLYSSEPFPAKGTRFNFTESLGLGLAKRVTAKLWLMAGTGWAHISNADISGDGKNPGFDGVKVYLGVLKAL